MRYVKSKLLQKPEGRKRGKYRLTVDLTDTDIEFFEELGGLPTRGIYTCKTNIRKGKVEPLNKELAVDVEYERKMYLLFVNIFKRIWKEHD